MFHLSVSRRDFLDREVIQSDLNVPCLRNTVSRGPTPTPGEQISGKGEVTDRIRERDSSWSCQLMGSPSFVI